MYPVISNRQYRLDRIMHNRKCRLGMAVIFLALMSVSAQAQQPAYAPPSETLWNQMVNALDGVSMPGSANRQVLQILQQVQQAAQQEAARANAMPAQTGKKNE